MIDWEAGLFGRLTATVNVTNAAASNTFLMKFEKFVKFILYEIENNMQSYGSLHWWPFSRLCGLCHIDYDFIGEYRNFTISYTEILLRKVDLRSVFRE